MRRPTSPQDAASRLAVARADYVPDAPKPTTQASHTGLAGVMRDLFDQITELRAQQHLWRHILDLLDRAELAPAGLTAKQLAGACARAGCAARASSSPSPAAPPRCRAG